LARSAQTDYSKGASSGTADSTETVKRLKKRELECQALWDTLKEQVQGNMVNQNVMMDLLSKRALNSKARRKLNLL